jgi:glycosyltransferase involved in cell wall biosynthesis
MQLLILYEELAWYIVNCFNYFAKNTNATMLVFSKRINQIAPFKFDYIHPNITIYEREDFSEVLLLKTCLEFNPQFLYLGGWSHKPYINLVKRLQVENSVIGFDNQFNGSLKQLIGSLYFRFNLKPYFKSAFVPGIQQELFAKRLGFKANFIAQGAYCCDTELFANYYIENQTKKELSFPKRFLFVGRYAAEKGILLLWECFTELQTENPNEWELWCLGKGEIAPINHPKIKHLGFLQPKELNEVISETGVFVLPSNFEPWGVVIHEYATAGYPILSTNKVGATTKFLQNNLNGFCIEANDKFELKNKLKEFMSMTNQKLNTMSQNSVKISCEITPNKWVNNLMNLYEHKKK